MSNRILSLCIAALSLPVKCEMEFNSTGSGRQQAVKNLFRSYNPYFMPPHDGPRPIMFTVAIDSIFDISELSSSFTVRYGLVMEWKDTRLQFPPFVENNTTVKRIFLPVGEFKDKGGFHTK